MKRFISIMVLLAMVFSISIVFTGCSGGGYEGVVKKYFKAMETADGNAHLSLLAKDYINYMTGSGSWYKDEKAFKESLTEDLQNDLSKYEREFGDKIRISPTITETKRYSSDEKESYSKKLTSWYGFKENSLQDIVELKVSAKITGSNGSGEYIYSGLKVIKIGGNWYIQKGNID